MRISIDQGYLFGPIEFDAKLLREVFVLVNLSGDKIHPVIETVLE